MPINNPASSLIPRFLKLATDIVYVRTWCCVLILMLTAPGITVADDNDSEGKQMFVWPGLAPGETSENVGEILPYRDRDQPPIMRVIKVRRPTMDVFLPQHPNGSAVLILPGGGFGRVVPNLEGSEAAPWLNRLGIAVFVLRYRTNEVTPKDEPAWKRPLQDTQRALRLIRSNAEAWKLDTNRIGVLGFSAGGQVATVLHTADGKPTYKKLDEIDRLSCRPNFSLLIYPWHVLNLDTGKLLSEIQFGKNQAPAFIVHTHDDASTSLGSIQIYIGLKRFNVPAELHIYENGGHGYGVRPVKDSNIGSWPDRATDWLVRRGLARKTED